MCEYNCSPSNEEIFDAYAEAHDNDCVVKLEWIMKYGGYYSRYVYPDSDVDEVIKSIRSIIYGM